MWKKLMIVLFALFGTFSMVYGYYKMKKLLIRKENESVYDLVYRVHVNVFDYFKWCFHTDNFSTSIANRNKLFMDIRVLRHGKVIAGFPCLSNERKCCYV